MAPVGNQALGPVYHVFVALRTASLDGLDVAARVGLGDADAASLLAGRHQGQESLLLLQCSVGRDHVGHDEVQFSSRLAHPSPADFLNDQGVGRDIQLKPAVLFGDHRAEQAQLLHPLHQLEGVLAACHFLGDRWTSLRTNSLIVATTSALRFRSIDKTAPETGRGHFSTAPELLRVQV